MLKYYCLLTGDDYRMLLNDTPASQKKIKLLGSCLFVPTFLWFINGYLLAKQVLQCSFAISITTAIICSFFIFFIERSIIMMKGKPIVIILRILMGLLVSILGSIAIDEVVFDRDITIQVTQNKPLMVNEEISKINATNKDDLNNLSQLVNVKYLAWQKAVNDAKQEADGSGGSGHRGVSAITKVKENYATQAQGDYENAKMAFDNLNNSIEQKNKQARSEFDANFNSRSILLRIKAFFDLVLKNTWMLVIYSVFTLLMLFLEFMVVFIKIFSNKTNYELKVEMIEEIGRRKMETINKNSHFDPIQFQPIIKQAKVGLKKQSVLF
jgi:hypothetical protein